MQVTFGDLETMRLGVKGTYRHFSLVSDKGVMLWGDVSEYSGKFSFDLWRQTKAGPRRVSDKHLRDVWHAVAKEYAALDNRVAEPTPEQSEYTITGDETEAARIIVKRALARGYVISVLGEGTMTLKRSSSESDMLAAISDLEDCYLCIRNSKGKYLGSLRLIFGNSAAELVADCTDNLSTLALLEWENTGDSYCDIEASQYRVSAVSRVRIGRRDMKTFTLAKEIDGVFIGQGTFSAPGRTANRDLWKFGARQAGYRESV